MRGARPGFIVLLLALACDESSPPAPAVTPTTKPLAEAAPTPVPDEIAKAGPAIAPPDDRGQAGDRPHTIVPEVELTAADVLAALERAAAGDTSAPGLDWQRRAAALLAGDAKLRQTLVDRLREPSCVHAAREFGVAILVTRGEADLQAALRGLLADPVVRAEPSFWMLISRIGAVPTPEDATIELTFSLRASDDPRIRQLATLAVGGHISRFMDSEQTAAARKLAGKLQALFKAEADPGQQALILEALGVGGHPQSRAFIRGFARSKVAQLRGGAAKAMKWDESSAAAALLLALIVDPDVEVQAAAVEALVDRPLDAAQQRILHAATVDGKVTPRNDGMLAILVSRRLVGDARRTALEVLLARNKADDWVRRDITDALASG